MTPALGRIWAIALNTFREAARIRVLHGVLVLVLGSNLLAIALGEASLQDAGRVARDVGLAGISLFGSLTAIFLGVFLLYTEVQRRTIPICPSPPGYALWITHQPMHTQAMLICHVTFGTS